MKDHWPLQARLIERNIRALTRGAEDALYFGEPAIKALEEILDRTSVGLCRCCKGQGHDVKAGEQRYIYQKCRECGGSGMVV